jgi:hypothetical protein
MHRITNTTLIVNQTWDSSTQVTHFLDHWFLSNLMGKKYCFPHHPFSFPRFSLSNLFSLPFSNLESPIYGCHQLSGMAGIT